MKAIVHIGSTKTGSTSLQNFLFKNRNKLNCNKIIYPNIGVKSGAHHLIAASFHQGAWRMHTDELGKAGSEKIERYKSALRKACTKEKQHTLLLSSEYLWTIRNKTRFVEFLHQIGATEVHVICYLRDVRDWIQSQYNQTVKSGNAEAFDAWLSKTLARKFGGANYEEILDDWAATKGIDSVVARGYSRETLPKGLIEDFLSALGVNSEEFNLEEAGQFNPSPTEAEVKIISILNAIDNIPEQEKAQLRGFLRTVSPNRSLFQDFRRLPREFSDKIEALLAEPVARVEKRYLHPDHAAMQFFSQVRQGNRISKVFD